MFVQDALVLSSFGHPTPLRLGRTNKLPLYPEIQEIKQLLSAEFFKDFCSIFNILNLLLWEDKNGNKHDVMVDLLSATHMRSWSQGDDCY